MTTMEETFWEKGNRTRMGVYITTVETDFLFSHFEPSKHQTTLDVGAGAGRFSIPMSERGSSIYSLDLDLHSLRRLKIKNQESKVFQSDARCIPLKDDSVNLVVTVELVDIVHELDRVVEEIARILKPDGNLILSFGNKSSLKGKLKSWRGKPYYHSYREVLASLDKAGFKILKRTGFNWIPFNRTSNSRLVPLLSRAERLLGLRKIVRYSPWVMLYAVISKQ